VNLRAICDNKKEVLMQVMPRFGLSDAELKSVVDSACKEPPKGVSKTLSSIIDHLSLTIDHSEEDAADTDVESAQDNDDRAEEPPLICEDYLLCRERRGASEDDQNDA
jgi:hypothetical protein